MPTTPRVSAESLKSGRVSARAPLRTAGTSHTSQPIFIAPYDIVIKKATIVGMAASAGIDAGNTSVWVLQKRLAGTETSLASITFNNVVLFPAAFTPYSLGVAAIGIKIPQGTLLCFTVTNGTTAATPETLVEVEYWINEDL